MVPKFLIINDSNELVLNEIQTVLEKYNFHEKVDIFVNIERNEIIDILNNKDNDIDILL
jgi:hypothetical protein